MTGTFINVTAIIVGGLLGIFFGARLSDNLKNTVVAGMGLFTTAIGFEMFLKTENPLVFISRIYFVLVKLRIAVKFHLHRTSIWSILYIKRNISLRRRR